MADEFLVSLLNQGVKAWNKWRKRSPDSQRRRFKSLHGQRLLQVLNLSQANLRGMNLCKADLSKMDLSKADLSKADLSEANLNEANLNEANLRMVNLTKADVRLAKVIGADLSEANLRGADFRGADLRSAKLIGADLRGANLSELDLWDSPAEANLSKANLHGANLQGANLHGANLKEANLSEADLRHADLSDADLSKADLTEADLRGATLQQTSTYRQSSLKSANFERTSVDETTFAEIIKHFEPPSRLYRVWYATNRKLLNRNALTGSYSSARSKDGEIHYGFCQIAIPESHVIGSVGSPWWKRILTTNDDGLKLCDHSVLVQGVYWDEVRKEFSQWGQGKRVALLFVHGYNVSFENAAIRAAQLGADLQVPLTGFFSWPSKGVLGGYAADAASIEVSESAIAEFLMRFSESGAEAVHLIAHSMGNRALLRSLQTIAQKAASSAKVPFGQIFLAAPDIDIDVFRNLAAGYRSVAQHTTLYVSAKDQALATSGTLYDYPRAGFVPPVTVIPGMDTIEVSDIDISLLGHGYFAEARDLLQDMYTQIWENKLPPRFGLVSAETPDGQHYWRIGR